MSEYHKILQSKGIRWLSLILVIFISLYTWRHVQSRISTPSPQPYSPSFGDSPVDVSPVLVFASHPLHNPIRLFELYQPLVDYLNSHVQGIRIKLETARDYTAFEERLYLGHYALALPNPYQTIIATKHGYRIFGKVRNDTVFRGIILLRKDSAINNLGDLKGKKIAYPSKTAVAACMLPQWYFRSKGLDVMHDLEQIYVGSQESSIMAVAKKVTDAAATWPPPWQSFQKSHPQIADQLKIMWETKSLINNGLVIRNDVPPQVARQIAEALFSLDKDTVGRKILADIGYEGFEAADDATYQPVRDFLQEFSRQVYPLEDSR